MRKSVVHIILRLDRAGRESSELRRECAVRVRDAVPFRVRRVCSGMRTVAH